MIGVLRLFQQYFSHITATAHIIHVFLGFTSTWLELWSVLPKEKIQRIQCGSNPGPLDYESNTLSLSHTGSRFFVCCLNLKGWDKHCHKKLLNFRFYFYQHKFWDAQNHVILCNGRNLLWRVTFITFPVNSGVGFWVFHKPRCASRALGICYAAITEKELFHHICRGGPKGSEVFCIDIQRRTPSRWLH